MTSRRIKKLPLIGVLRYLGWAALITAGVILVLVLTTFDIKDMTLANSGMVSTYNEGWVFCSSTRSIETEITLPYSGASDAGEIVTISNTIPEGMSGQSISFLSASKTVEVSVGGELIYNFGTEDVKWFGRAPGSIYNFVDIPEGSDGKTIQISFVSPYEDYAAKIDSINVGERSVLIMRLVESNLFNYCLNVVVLFACILFLIFAFVRIKSKEPVNGLFYLAVLAFMESVYFFIETKTMSIFFGNQSFYANVIFLVNLLLPIFLLLYYL